MSRSITAGAIAALALLAPQVATAAPSVEKGWPRVAPPGFVVSDVRGGAVFSGSHTAQEELSIATVALTRRGATRWTVDRMPACGNCDGYAQIAAQPDRTFGPIGFTGDDFWAVTGTGEVVDGCTGEVLPDGTCISHQPGEEGNLVTATRGGVTLWEYVEPDFRFVSINDDPEPIARDESGVTYIGYDRGWDASGEKAAARLLAINPDGSLRWRKLNGPRPDTGWGRVRAALRGGVVIETRSGVTAYNAAGRKLWSVKVGPRRLVEVVSDPKRNRVFLLTRVKTGIRIDALHARSGRTLWKTTTGGYLADIGRDGTLYVADRLKNGSGAVRAIRRSGKLKWRFRTASHVVDAAELTDRRVALSTADGLALRVNPQRRARTVARSNVALTPRDIRTACTRPGFSGEPCTTGSQWGAILRINMTRAVTLSVRFVGRDGRPDRIAIRAPRGRSFHRLFVGDTSIKKGTSTVTVSWREGGTTQTRRMPVSVK